MKICLRCDHSFASNDWACPKCDFVSMQLAGFSSHAPDFAHRGDGFKSDYFANLAILEEGNFWFRMRNKLITWAIKRFQPTMNNYLEVGCDTGFVLSGIAANFPKAKLLGTEIFIAGLPFAAKRVSSAQFMQMDARNIPFREEFDVVGAFDVLEHIKEDERVMGQLFHAIRPGGVLLVTVPQHPWLWSAADDYACHVRRYTASEIEKKLFASGFKIERSTSFVSLLMPAMLLSRLQHKHTSKNYNPNAELQLPRPLNAIFMSLMFIELAFIRIGINLPFGGSRLVVARKAT